MIRGRRGGEMNQTRNVWRRASIKVLKEDITILEAKVRDLQAKCDSWAHWAEKTEAELAECRAERDKLKEEVGRRKAGIDVYMRNTLSRISSLGGENKTLREERDRLMAELAEEKEKRRKRDALAAAAAGEKWKKRQSRLMASVTLSEATVLWTGGRKMSEQANTPKFGPWFIVQGLTSLDQVADCIRTMEKNQIAERKRAERAEVELASVKADRDRLRILDSLKGPCNKAARRRRRHSC